MMDEQQQSFINYVYDSLNDASDHDLMHIVYMCLDSIPEDDYE